MDLLIYFRSSRAELLGNASESAGFTAFRGIQAMFVRVYTGLTPW